MPAQAGIQFLRAKALGPRFRGDERSAGIRPLNYCAFAWRNGGAPDEDASSNASCTMAQCRPGFELAQSSAPTTMKAGSNTKSAVATTTPPTRSETTERPVRITGAHDQYEYAISDYIARILGSARPSPNRPGFPREQGDNGLRLNNHRVLSRKSDRRP